MSYLYIRIDLENAPINQLGPQTKEITRQTLKSLGEALVKVGVLKEPNWSRWVKVEANQAVQAVILASILTQYSRMEDVIEILSLAILMYIQLVEPELPAGYFGPN